MNIDFIRKTLAVGLLSLFGIFWVVGVTRARWGTLTADSAHTYRVVFKGGEALWFTPWIGWSLQNGFWVWFVAFGVLGLIDWRLRRNSARQASTRTT